MSVVVPAHDESVGIERCLAALLDGHRPGEIEIVVVANGCSDDTARVARAFGPPVTVLELEVASKVAALNAGDAMISGFPRFYVDADVVVSLSDLRHVAAALVDGAAHLAAPSRRWVTDGRPWVVRSYVRFLECLPQVRSSLMGGGVLGVSEEGRGRFGAFPDVIGDDLFLESRFRDEEKRVVAAARSQVEMPRTLSGLIARRTRVVLANREAAARADARRRGGRWSNLGAALRGRPSLALHLPAFLAVTLVAELRARRRLRAGSTTWERDESTRHPVTSPMTSEER